ncbi:hypothetical protein G6F23_013102 [Rhizopus arrhizus]|nr:hypothetical protein G6F23_013102 [Rhizopus arrhizus]
MFAGDDAQRVAASQQRVDRAAQRQHGHAGGDGRVGGTQGVQRSTDRGDREQRIHDYRQLKLDAFAQALRPGAQGVHAQQDVSGVGQQRLALRGHDGPAAAAVEQRHAQLVFHVGDGVADRRLHAGQPAPSRAEAAGVGHGGEHAQLVQGKSVYHLPADLFSRSVPSKDYHLSRSFPAGMLSGSHGKRGGNEPG